MKRAAIGKLLSWVLAAATLLSLAACNTDQGKEPTNTTTATEEVTQPPVLEQEITFPKSEMSRFKIVYADGSSDEVVNSATSLSKLILSSCGYEPIITNDFIREGSSTFCEYEYEILVGETNREESISFIQSIRQDDKAYTCIGTKILIGARDDKLLMECIDEFCVQVVMGKKKDEMFFRSEWATYKAATYATDTLTVNGIAIQDYTIIHPVKNSAFEKALAEKLQLAIADATGYILPIEADTKAKDDRPELRIGAAVKGNDDKSCAEGAGYTKGSGNTVYLYGTTPATNGLAVEAFVDAIAANTRNSACELTYGAKKTVEWDRSTTVAMTFNVLTVDLTPLRKDAVVATILRTLPDVFGVQEANPNWMSLLDSRLGAYYGHVGTGTGGGSTGEHVAIFYSRERYNLIEGNTYWLTDTPEENSVMPGTDWPRVFTYVVLEDKVTGEQFLHLNVHLDTASSDIRYAEAEILMKFLKNYNHLPVILSGDLNAYADSKEMQYFFSNGFIQPIDALEDAKNQPPTCYYGYTIIDYVLVTNDCLEMTDYKVDGDLIFGIYASDHNATTITFRFREMEGEIDHNWKDPVATYPDEWLDVEEEGEADPSFGGIHLIP